MAVSLSERTEGYDSTFSVIASTHITCFLVIRVLFLDNSLCVQPKNGFAVIDDVEGKPTLNYLARPLDHDPERSRAQRFNDGACDAKGRFFAGTLSMSSNSPYIGQLWCYDPSIGQAKLIDDDVLVSCISPYMRLW